MDISKGRLKAITRFDRMHMGAPAFRSDATCQKDAAVVPFLIPQTPVKWTVLLSKKMFLKKKFLLEKINTETLSMFDTNLMIWSEEVRGVRTKRRRRRCGKSFRLEGM